MFSHPTSISHGYFSGKPQDVRQGPCMRSGTHPPRTVLESIVYVILKEGLQRQGTRLGLILGVGYTDLTGLFLLPAIAGNHERRLEPS